MKRIFLVLFISMILGVVKAQNADDVNLAYSYYNSNEYEKASYLFENLYNKTKSKHYFTYYVNCLINIENYEKAEKAVKKQISNYKADLTYKILLGYVYKRENQLDKAQEEYENVISQIKPDRNQIIQCLNQFSTVSEPDYAEKTLLKARELLNESFNYELFSVYAGSRNFKKMAQAGLDLIEEDEGKLSTVQNMFQYYINSDVNDEFYNILRSDIVLRIQKKPTVVMSEFLIWLFLQKKNFKSAFTQAKALDKRLSEQGQRLVMLGDEALAAKDYAAASDCYSYVTAKGENCPFYRRALFGVLTSMYEQVVEGEITDSLQISYLESQYIKTFNDFGINNQVINEVKNYSTLETYYLNNPEKAKDLIEKSLQVPSLNYSQRAQLNLLLGGIELFMGDVWAATMTFAKVENDNKQNEYGDMAKFSKAKIAYYTGNFKWAASQLDVLKAATTKLVANDAMELSLLISDNAERVNSVVGDTLSPIDENLNSSVDLRIYARADMYYSQNQFDKAVASLDSIVEKYPQSALIDECLFLKAKIYERKRNWQNSAFYYKKVSDEYSYDILADKAAFQYAEISYKKLNDIENAKNYYMKILTNYPGSVYAVNAREMYRLIEKK